ncbi:hypothetical protein [Burkholderia sp. RF2-non_BP3]|uniref:hypothetical protein n=1 Tax=Burkholderia sp. RF2-non_BP3 TaxID=1637844 RepID=UPI0012E36A25|nr:hypothetical protein [Burkholderia sp. RF2-non_BP3]
MPGTVFRLPLPVIAFTLRLKSESSLDVSVSLRQERVVRREDIEHVVRLTQKPGHIRYRTDGVDVRGSDAKRGPVAAQIWNRSFSSEISRATLTAITGCSSTSRWRATKADRALKALTEPMGSFWPVYSPTR